MSSKSYSIQANLSVSIAIAQVVASFETCTLLYLCWSGDQNFCTFDYLFLGFYKALNLIFPISNVYLLIYSCSLIGFSKNPKFIPILKIFSVTFFNIYFSMFLKKVCNLFSFSFKIGIKRANSFFWKVQSFYWLIFFRILLLLIAQSLHNIFITCFKAFSAFGRRLHKVISLIILLFSF